jgi:hypothetical protein
VFRRDRVFRDRGEEGRALAERAPSYGHFALHAFAVAFFAQVSKAVASFLGFAAEGGVAESTHEAAPDEQLWKESRVA